MTLAEKIQKLRKEKGLSQDQLALELGVSRQSISKWELGDSMPDISKILQLSDYFQVSTDYLLREEIEIATEGPRSDPTPKTAAEELHRKDTYEESPHPDTSSMSGAEPSTTSDKRPFDRAFKISLWVTIAFILLPFVISILASLLHKNGGGLGAGELLLILTVVFGRIVPILGIITLVFWILRHLKK